MFEAHIRRGLIRGWIVFTFFWCFSILAYSAWRVFEEPTCYAFDSITLNEGYKGEWTTYVRDLRQKLLDKKTICGGLVSTDLLSLESYAKEKAISQVAFGWKEPGGWSTETRAMLDVLDNDEITSSRITGDVDWFVRKARISAWVPCLIVMLSMPFLLSGIGAGVCWTAMGFKKR
jgi:hypothetical protein